MWRFTLILIGLSMSLFSDADGSECLVSKVDSDFYALSPSAHWMVQLSWRNNNLILADNVRIMSDESLNLRVSIGSQLGFDSVGRIVLSGEVVHEHNARRVIARLDPWSDKFSILGDGYGHVSLPSANEVLFFKYNEGLDDQWIYVAVLGERELVDTRRLFALDGYTRLVPMSDDFVAFYDAATEKAYVYSAQAKEINELHSERACDPMGVRAITSEWICRSPSSPEHFFLVDERGTQTEEFDLGTPVVAVGYLRSRDSLLFSRIETSKNLREEVNFYEYVFGERLEMLVGRDLRVSPHSVSQKPQTSETSQ